MPHRPPRKKQVPAAANIELRKLRAMNDEQLTDYLRKTGAIQPNQHATREANSDAITIITKEELTDAQRNTWYCMMAFMNAMIEQMDKLKGTSYYNSRLRKAAEQLESETELYQKAKTGKVWKKDTDGIIGDVITSGSEIAQNILYTAFALAGQPPEVQERYNKEYIDLTVKYGIAHPDTFKK